MINAAKGSIVVGTDLGVGVSFNAGEGNTLLNQGLISVGAGSTGVSVLNSHANKITNEGTISAGAGGMAVSLIGDGNVLDNWGTISVATPSSTVRLVADTTGDAIYVSGFHNTIDLHGHSVVTGGKIHGLEDLSNGNTLKLDFTGVSLAEQAALKVAVTNYMENPVGECVFYIHGVKYVVDPMNIDYSGITSYQQQGLTGNQGGVGAGLDNINPGTTPSAAFLALYATLDAVGQSDPSGAAVAVALNAMSPHRYQLYGDIAVATMSGVTQQIDQRLVSLSGNGDLPEKRGNIWVSGGHKSATVDAVGSDLTDAKFTTNSLVVGADFRVSPNFTLGALFHTSDSNDAKLDTIGSTANVKSKGFGVYAGYRQGGFYTNGLFSHSNNDYKSTRIVSFRTVPADPATTVTGVELADASGKQTGFGLDGGYDFKVSDTLTVGPLVGLQYVKLDVDAFNEAGTAPYNLAVAGQSMTSLLGRVGGRLSFHTPMSSTSTFSMDFRAAFQHEFQNSARDITANFAGNGNFSVRTTDPKRNSVLGGLGVGFNFSGRTTVFANYDMQAGQSNWHEQNISGGVKICF